MRITGVACVSRFAKLRRGEEVVGRDAEKDEEDDEAEDRRERAELAAADRAK